ncbi:glycosyltransferase [uncultured Ferrovibrio sp.]|uniref:glycosyltransferase n=1 Tax=uncultured Ferrovibrio sp. TaxID=1576913 RepID=UPI002603B5C6|nr:glycosyltransferase [uncultured Ferrovibrio sp.]
MIAYLGMPRKIVYFTPEISDTSTITRAEALLEQGSELVVIGFRRDRYNTEFQPPWRCLTLGRTQDGRYTQRLFALLAALPGLIAHRRVFQDADIFYARNIDQLLLALFARLVIRRAVPIIYEVLDIQPIFVGTGLMSRLIRAAERYGLRKTDLLVVSSPAFVRNYFAPIQGYSGSWYLLENKLPLSIQRIPDATPAKRGIGVPRSDGYRWTVSYCGLIRGHDTIDLIVRLAERLQGVVLFKFYGVLTTVDGEYFNAAISRLRNMVYEGPYINPDDLPRIYGDTDFCWALDLENTEHNSRWLLPCRFYEAGYFGVPCLAANGFEVGSLVDQLGVGWSFPEPYIESLTKFFLTVTPAEYEERQARLLAQPADRFVAIEDTADLLEAFDHARGQENAKNMNEIKPARVLNKQINPDG